VASASSSTRATSNPKRVAKAAPVPIAERSQDRASVAVKTAARTLTDEPPRALKKNTEPQNIRGIPDVLNSGLLSIDGQLIALYGVKGAYEPHSTQLTQFIQDREVRCQPMPNKTYRCQLGQRDVSEAVLSNGAGWATEDAPEALKNIESKARDRGVGVWQ
ncbi:MAG: hypothetical protein ACE1Y4_13845, partial [Lysobacterales bacterium]